MRLQLREILAVSAICLPRRTPSGTRAHDFNNSLVLGLGIGPEILSHRLGVAGYIASLCCLKIPPHAVCVREKRSCRAGLTVSAQTLEYSFTSAPMFAIVAIPVQESVSTPGPKYSRIRPVAPFTVNNPANLSITSIRC